MRLKFPSPRADALGNGNKGKGKGADESGSGSQLHRQSFYSALQKRQEENASKGKAKGRSRGAKKGMAEGIGDLPKFDIKRAFPGLSFGTWQIEAAEQPSHTLIQCRDAHQIHLFQDMGKLINIKDKIFLFAGASPGDPEVPGGKKVLLPYLGNIALREAWIGLINGAEVGDSYGTLPKKSEVKAPAKTATTTLRINAALDFIQQPLKDQILRSPSLALAAAQIAECVGEAKTFKWSTSAHRMLSGYVSFDSSKVEEVMSHSGRNGIFFQRLAVHVSTQPEVDWISPAEQETNAAYLDRCLLDSKKINSFLTYRRGGGACIGVVHKQLLDKCRHWCLYGLDSSYGPTCVSELLKSLQWEVPHRPSAPQGRNRPWLFYGKLATDAAGERALDYSYELEGKDSVKQFLRITVHQRRKKEEAEALDVRPHWWDPTQKFEAEIAPTVMEISQDSNGSPSKTSPLKKKQKLDGFDPAKPGPGQFPLVNLGGSGDCGWRCLSYSLAAANTKCWKDSPDEEKKFTSKIKEVAGLLRTQVVHSLLGRTEWEDSWAMDNKATELTEGGPVASNVIDFKASLAREHRWICGLTMSEASKIKKLNVVIFEWIGKAWKRTGLVLAKDTNPQKYKTAVLVLEAGHYWAVRTCSVPDEWLDCNGVVWCSRWKKYTDYFSRGGVGGGFETPIKKKILDDFLHSCSSKSVGEIRTASSRKSCSLAKDIRSASSRKIIKTSGKKVQDSGDAMARHWTCKICGMTLSGPDYPSIRGCIMKHLMVDHQAMHRQILQERRAEGMSCSGLGIKQMADPRPFVSSAGEAAIFICPWCEMELPGPLSQYIAKKSKRRHMDPVASSRNSGRRSLRSAINLTWPKETLHSSRRLRTEATLCSRRQSRCMDQTSSRRLDALGFAASAFHRPLVGVPRSFTRLALGKSCCVPLPFGLQLSSKDCLKALCRKLSWLICRRRRLLSGCITMRMARWRAFQGLSKTLD